MMTKVHSTLSIIKMEMLYIEYSKFLQLNIMKNVRGLYLGIPLCYSFTILWYELFLQAHNIVRLTCPQY